MFQLIPLNVHTYQFEFDKQEITLYYHSINEICKLACRSEISVK